MGYIYLFSGTGAGKTTNALGLALRSVGHRHTVVIVQFLKWLKTTGEYKVKDLLQPYYEIYQFGRKAWLGPTRKTLMLDGKSFQVEPITEQDRGLALKGLDFARNRLLQQPPNLLILDEINLAAHWGLLTPNEIVAVLDTAPKKTDIVLTGRFAPDELIAKADFVNVIYDTKAPDRFENTQGIQY